MSREAENKGGPIFSRVRLWLARKELRRSHLSTMAKCRRALRHGKPCMIQARIVQVEALLEIKAFGGWRKGFWFQATAESLWSPPALVLKALRNLSGYHLVLPSRTPFFTIRLSQK